MDIEVHIFALLETIIFLLIILVISIYSIPIICVRRFHQPSNMLTLNICLATVLCCLSWLPVYAAFMINNPYPILEKIILAFSMAETIFTIQVPFSFVVASLHRYCSVVYHAKIFFRSKRWIILCIGIQWILGFILTIPNLICLYNTCGASAWPNIYSFGSIVMIPSIMCFVINMLIYQHVRSSSRRIQPQMVFGDVQQPKISRRDIVLVRHMILMFCIFVGGWAPVYLIPIIQNYTPVQAIVSSSFTVWCELALLFDMIDLFLYNHELRQYLTATCMRIFHRLRELEATVIFVTYRILSVVAEGLDRIRPIYTDSTTEN